MKNKTSTLLTIVFTLAVIAALVFCLVMNGNVPTDTNNSTATSDNSEVVSVDSSKDDSDTSMPDTPSTPTISDDPVSEASDEPQDKVVHFVGIPDSIIHASVYYDAIDVAARKKGVASVYKPLAEQDYDFSEIYKNFYDTFKSADLSYINLETLVCGDSYGISSYPSFNSPEQYGEYICEMGIDIINVAHNHMLDCQNAAGLKSCNDFFTSRGKTVIGYYEDTAATENITVVEKNGIKIALLAYTYSCNGHKVDASKYTTYIPLFDEALIRKQVALAKQQADIVLVSAHWGNENSYKIDSQQNKYGDLFVELGVDIVLGMHPHCIQEMCWKEGKDGSRTLMIYSLGNFVSGMQDDTNLLGGYVSLDIVKDAITGKCSLQNVIFTPVVTFYTEPGGKLNSSDSGQRDYCVYELCDFTQELCDAHEINNMKTDYKLVGGKWSIQCLYQTVQKYIASEFLEEKYRG